eukprot:2534343-Rhodomonas_salina.1
MSGTDIAYGADHVTYWLRACYAMSGTDIGYPDVGSPGVQEEYRGSIPAYRLTRSQLSSSAFAMQCPILIWHPLASHAVAMRLPVLTWLSSYAFATRCPVLTSGMVLPGGERGVKRRGRGRGVRSTDVRRVCDQSRCLFSASSLRACYAISGTDLRLCCHAMYGTDVHYAAMQCVVLISAMLLRN